MKYGGFQRSGHVSVRPSYKLIGIGNLHTNGNVNITYRLGLP